MQFPAPIEVRLHENKRTYLRVERRWGKITLHLHRLFEKAPSPVLEALVRFALKRDRKSLAVIRQMAHLHFSTARMAADPLEQKGEVYDLAEIYERIKEKFFDSGYDASIGWSKRQPRGSFRSVTFGCYDRMTHQIRINRLLDSVKVPLYFVEFIVYHEMLHAICPTEMDARGRAKIHTVLFKQLERKFPEYEEAKKWQKTSLALFRAKKR
jgi:hypothetical protein